MKVAFVVHGFVQGVGYRYFVRGVALRFGIHGFVENKKDGSVLVVAQGEEEALERFEAAINISEEHGVQVLSMEKVVQNDPDFPKARYNRSKFAIRK
ncbi:MAG: acylphosphatase [Candidatus Micrarchaeota archaeon]|nr:acylphosphatase [Candidatus Micrarchaeota archaeon]